MSDEFYIGWESKAAPGMGKAARRIAASLLVCALVAPVVLAVSQRTIGAGVFEWGEVKPFSGILQAAPYPRLLVSRPGDANGWPGHSTYYLVAPLKFGLDPKTIAAMDGKPVTLKGTLVYSGNQTMIEAIPDSIREEKKSASPAPSPPSAIRLGKHTLVGEIVDSKCFLGVMNPGRLAPHRACAIRCISGGCPPMLVTRRHDGSALYLLLASADGRPVNKEVLDMIATPLEITGEVEGQGDLLILRADPKTYRRL
jgi:hypothetical protein